jgi:hypothetical protein
VGWEADFVLNFKAVPWPVAKTNISLSTCKSVDGYATSVGTQSSTRGILRVAAGWGVAGLPPDHQSGNTAGVPRLRLDEGQRAGRKYRKTTEQRLQSMEIPEKLCLPRAPRICALDVWNRGNSRAPAAAPQSSVIAAHRKFRELVCPRTIRLNPNRPGPTPYPKPGRIRPVR